MMDLFMLKRACLILCLTVGCSSATTTTSPDSQPTTPTVLSTQSVATAEPTVLPCLMAHGQDESKRATLGEVQGWTCEDNMGASSRSLFVCDPDKGKACDELDRVVGLNIEGVGDRHVEGLKGLKNLTWLELNDTTLTPRGLAAINVLYPNIEILGLSGERVDDALVAGLGGMNLKRARLRNTKVTTKGLAMLPKTLQTLRAPKETDDAGVVALMGHKALTRLDLAGTDITKASLKTLATFTGLDVLDLRKNDLDPEDIFALRRALPTTRILFDKTSKLYADRGVEYWSDGKLVMGAQTLAVTTPEVQGPALQRKVGFQRVKLGKADALLIAHPRSQESGEPGPSLNSVVVLGKKAPVLAYQGTLSARQNVVFEPAADGTLMYVQDHCSADGEKLQRVHMRLDGQKLVEIKREDTQTVAKKGLICSESTNIRENFPLYW